MSSICVQERRKRQRHILSPPSPVSLKNNNNHMVTRTVHFAVVVLFLLVVGLPVSAWTLPTARRIVTLPSLTRHSTLYQAISASAISTSSTPPSTATTSATASSPTLPVSSHPGENDEEGNSSAARRWLGILSKGSKKKGVSDVKLREAEELGGLPRSDRYSSRYVVVRLLFLAHGMYIFSCRSSRFRGERNESCNVSSLSAFFNLSLLSLYYRIHTEIGFTIQSHCHDRRF